MKDAYYFQHDANARHDPKLLMLRKEHGVAGIGRWWILVEILREQEDYHFDIGQKHNFRALKHELDFTDEKELHTFLDDLNEFSLIVRMNEIIFSPALIKRMGRLDAVREKRSEAGIKSGEARRNKSERTSKTLQTEFKDTSEKTNHLSTYLSTNSRSELSTNQQTYSSIDLPTAERNAPVPTASASSFAKTSVTTPTFPQALNTAAQGTKTAPSALGDLLREPDTENIYIYPIVFHALPAGNYFVPSDPDHNEQRVYLKLSDAEVMTVKERRIAPVKEPTHLVFAAQDFMLTECQANIIH